MTTYEIGMTLERKRIALGMSRRYVQEKTGLGKSKIAGFLNGTTKNPRLDTIFLLCQILGCTIRLGLENDPTITDDVPTVGNLK